MMEEDQMTQEYFMKLKAICVPLMGMSRLTFNSYKKTASLLDDLTQLLGDIPSEYLFQNLISYIFFPLSSILQRNPSSQIPDQILEKILRILALLVESWWWTCDIKVWEQIFMLCGAVIGDIKSKDTKEKSRDDETKEAAASCLNALLRPRSSKEALGRHLLADQPKERLFELQFHVQTSSFIPVIGQSLDSLLVSSASHHLPLQRASLDIINHLVELYLPDPMIPSILPGVVSTMTKICVSVKGWANSEIVTRALLVMQAVIIKAVNDEICIQCGALRAVRNLDDLVKFNDTPHAATENASAYGTVRTESWLCGTGTQLHIAINSLTSLLSHPNASVLRSLSDFSAKLMESTPLALPKTQPLLLSFLLSLSLSDYTSVSSKARQSLLDILSQTSSSSLQQTLMNNLGSNLSALPRLISTQADAKIMHTAGLIEAVCKLGLGSESSPGLTVVAKGVGKLLGPTGGIEKWGWSLLNVLELIEPPIAVTCQSSSAQLMLEDDSQMQQPSVFPELLFKNIASYDTRNVIVNMFHALGAASGDVGLFAVEWFFHAGCSATSPTSVAALWCACRLLEGIASISLFDEHVDASPKAPYSRRLEKHSKFVARSIAEIWDQSAPTLRGNAETSENNDVSLLVQHQSGLVPLHETLMIIHPAKSSPKIRYNQPIIHRTLCLQLLAISAGILKERFSPLFIHTLYPVLHSLVSPISFLSVTALSTLNFITIATSFASSANLLLSNFDYVLDSVSRRLTHRWLDLEATKVLSIMVRLVGADIVERAGDIVEECFDRLDEFHGYGVIVDGLIEVLNEVLKVIELEERANTTKNVDNTQAHTEVRDWKFDEFLAFLVKRNDDPITDEDKTDYGPAPREPWGEKKAEDERKPEAENAQLTSVPSSDEPQLTTMQSLTKQIISRSMYFLTNNSPVIRAKILNLLALAVPVLSESSLLPSIHSAWPFILNRMEDSETFVVSAAAGVVEALAEHVGDYMFRRIWDDVWPRFRSMLHLLEKGEASNALSRREGNRTGTKFAYTHSHRLYKSLLKTMMVALKGVHPHEPSFWEVIVAFRRFLSCHAHEELQHLAVNLYMQASKRNPDAVWLLLTFTIYGTDPVMAFLKEPRWEIDKNAIIILQSLS